MKFVRWALSGFLIGVFAGTLSFFLAGQLSLDEKPAFIMFLAGAVFQEMFSWMRARGNSDA